MKQNYNKFVKLLITSSFGLIIGFNSWAQPYPFALYPNSSTDQFFRYVPKSILLNGTNYITGYLTLSTYRNNTTQQYFESSIPVQKIQMQGGNILLCRTSSTNSTLDINPTSKNGAILFGDVIAETSGFIHGKWGIEYDDQYSTGGLNIFKPKSSLTATRINHSLFIRNDGFVGINTGIPATRLHVVGDATVSTLANSGDKIVTTDATGKLGLILKSSIADNMGNCEAGFNIKLGTKSISYDGTSVGLSVDNKNNVLVSDNLYIASDLGVGNVIYGNPYTENYFKLQLNGSILTDAARIELCDGHADNWRSTKFIIQGRTADYQFWIDNATALKFNKTLMTVGNSESLINLRVNGKIDANEVEVSLNHWNDYVFHDGYKLMPIPELESFIAANKHLPEIPSEKEVLENGINIGEMNALLLKKIEELTLYVIDLKKENEEIKIRLNKQGL